MNTIVIIEMKDNVPTGEVYATTDVTVGAVERNYAEEDEGYQNDICGAPGTLSMIGEQSSPADDLIDQIQTAWENYQNGPADEPADSDDDCGCDDDE